MKNRAERRKDPDQWWQVVSYFSDNVVKEVKVGEDSVYVRGSVADVVVVQLPDMPTEQLLGMMKGMTMALEAAGIMSALVIPHGIEFMKMLPVDPAKSRELDRGQRLKQDRTEPKGGPN